MRAVPSLPAQFPLDELQAVILPWMEIVNSARNYEILQDTLNKTKGRVDTVWGYGPSRVPSPRLECTYDGGSRRFVMIPLRCSL